MERAGCTNSKIKKATKPKEEARNKLENGTVNDLINTPGRGGGALSQKLQTVVRIFNNVSRVITLT